MSRGRGVFVSRALGQKSRLHSQRPGAMLGAQVLRAEVSMVKMGCLQSLASLSLRS